MGAQPRADPAGDQSCRACGLALPTHLRCTCCGILVGPRHVEALLAHGLCSTCARSGSDLGQAPAERRNPAAEGGGLLPWARVRNARRGGLTEQ